MEKPVEKVGGDNNKGRNQRLENKLVGEINIGKKLVQIS